MADQVEFFLVNKNNAIIYDKCFMTYDQCQKRNEWIDRFGSKNISWFFDYELKNLYIKLGMIPDPNNNIFGGDSIGCDI